MYSREDVTSAPFNFIRFEGTNVEVVAYKEGKNNLWVRVTVNGVDCYRAVLEQAFKRGLVPRALPETHPLQDAFVVRALEG